MKTCLAVLVFASFFCSLAGAARAQGQRADDLVRGRADSPSADGDDCGSENLLAGKAPAPSLDVEGDVALLTNGAVAPEGAEWDSPAAAVTFEGKNTGIVFDLGRPRSVGAFFLQADANDSYKIAGSPDGSPGSYRPIVEIDNVLASGHGLRSRAVDVPRMSARFLRITAGTGDGRYSVSELAAYCKTPAPFPPVFRTVDVPFAERASTPAPTQTAGEEETTGTGIVVFLAAAAVAFAGWGYDRTRKRAPAPTGGQGGASAADAREASGAIEGRLRLIFLASGCAALIYEVVWFHLLRLVIGASALSVAIVLASFMGGMFLGSLLFARFVPPERHPLRVYALLEIGIGIFGLSMPVVLPAARFVYVGLFGYGPLGIVLRALVAAVLLLPPTALMGATLPAIARRYSQGRRGMSGLASLYSANTIGAVLGSLVSAFWLLAYFDVWVATFAAVALNLAAGAYAWRLGARAPADAAPAAAPRVDRVRTNQIRAVYAAAALSGMTALGAQVVWTRLLTLLFGATVFAFAIILAVFLAGLGIGSAIAANLLRRGRDALATLAWSQLALVPTVLLGAFLVARVLPHSSPTAGTPVGALHALHVLRAIDVLLPAAVLWGMSFPLALAAGAGTADPARSTGRIYAANTLGAIAGALVTSFIAIPTWGTRWAEQALVVAAGVSAALLFQAGRGATLGRGGTEGSTAPAGDRLATWSGSPVAALVVGVAAAAVLPGMPRAFQAHGRYIWWVDPADRYPYVREGAASTVAVHIAPDGHRNFHVSGRVEASSNPNDMRLQRLLGHLSALALPHPEAVLVVGLGAGVTAGALALHPEIKRIVICEIEPRVVGAAEQFAQENYGVLTDPRVQVVFDDARHFLATTPEKFDIITSDPIHPWVRGNSVLFSREYYAIVKSHLRPGGIATQWVPLYETTELAIQIQMRTFMDAFPDGTVWNSAKGGSGYDVVLLGAAEPMRIDVQGIEGRMGRSQSIVESLRHVKINSVFELLGTYGTNGRDMREWLRNTPINRDFSLKLEYISGLALNEKQADPIYAHMVAGRSYPEDLFIAPPAMQSELRRRIVGHALEATR